MRHEETHGQPVLELLEVVILTRRLIFIHVRVALVTVAGAFHGVVAACGGGICSGVGSVRASRRTETHPPQLVGKGPPPAARLANRAQEPDELGGLLPVRSSLGLRPPRTLLVHRGQHLADVRSQ